MPLRLLGYVGEILTQQHKTHGLPLPPALPFVLLLYALHAGA